MVGTVPGEAGIVKPFASVDTRQGTRVALALALGWNLLGAAAVLRGFLAWY